MEGAIRAGGIAVDANLAGFAGGYELARRRLEAAGDASPGASPADADAFAATAAGAYI